MQGVVRVRLWVCILSLNAKLIKLCLDLLHKLQHSARCIPQVSWVFFSTLSSQVSDSLEFATNPKSKKRKHFGFWKAQVNMILWHKKLSKIVMPKNDNCCLKRAESAMFFFMSRSLSPKKKNKHSSPRCFHQKFCTMHSSRISWSISLGSTIALSWCKEMTNSSGCPHQDTAKVPTTISQHCAYWARNNLLQPFTEQQNQPQPAQVGRGSRTSRDHKAGI